MAGGWATAPRCRASHLLLVVLPGHGGAERDMVGNCQPLPGLAGICSSDLAGGGWVGHGTAFRASHLLPVVLHGAWWR